MNKMLRGQISYQIVFGSFVDGKFIPGITSAMYNRLHVSNQDTYSQEHYVGGSTTYSTEISADIYNSDDVIKEPTSGAWLINTKAENNVTTYKNLGYKVFEYAISQSSAKTELPVAFRSQKLKINKTVRENLTFTLTEIKRRNRKTYGLTISSDTDFTPELLEALFKFVHNSPLVFNTTESQRAIRQVNQLFDIHDTRTIQAYSPTKEVLAFTDDLFSYYSMPIMGDDALLIFTEDGVFLYTKNIIKIGTAQLGLTGQVFRGFYSDKFYVFDVLNKKELTYEYRLRYLATVNSEFITKFTIYANPDTESFFLNNANFLEVSSQGVLYIPNTSYVNDMPWYVYTPEKIIRLNLHVYPDGELELLTGSNELFEGSPNNPLVDFKVVNEEKDEDISSGIYDFVVEFDNEHPVFVVKEKKFRSYPKHTTLKTWDALHDKLELDEVLGKSGSDFYDTLAKLKNRLIRKYARGSMLLIGTDATRTPIDSDLLNSFLEIFHVTTTDPIYPEMLHIRVPDYQIETIYAAISQFRTVPFELIVCDTSLAEVGAHNMMEINRIFKSHGGKTIILDMDKRELENLKYNENNILYRERQGKETYLVYKVVFDGLLSEVLNKDEIKEASDQRKEFVRAAKIQANMTVRTRYGSAKDKAKYGQIVYRRLLDVYDSSGKTTPGTYSIPMLDMNPRELSDFSQLSGGVFERWSLPKLITYDTKIMLNLFSTYIMK